MVILDTSFLYALLHQKDKHHLRAQKIAHEELEGGLAYLPIAVFQETITLLNLRQGTDVARKMGSYLLSDQSPATLLKMDEACFDDVWKLFQKLGAHQLSMIDATLLYLSIEYEAQLISFDEELLGLYDQLK